jgi:hypothetical protein
MARSRSPEIDKRLEFHRRDFAAANGRPFTHFFCPILGSDEPSLEPTRLIKGHIMNKAVVGAPGAWVVQRSDVDNFYGSHFEAEFELIQYRDRITPFEVLSDKTLSKKFGPRILVDGKEVPHRSQPSSQAHRFGRVVLGEGPSPSTIEIRMSPEGLAANAKANWEFVMIKDLRIPTLVSLIKAAHLVLFYLLGYRYVTSAAGLLVGRDMLGQFFRMNLGRPRKEVQSSAHVFFREFAHVFRPLLHVDVGYRGTLSDRMMLVCHSTSGGMWAKIILTKVGDQMHAVMIPIFTSAESVPTFLDFMRNENERLQVSTMQFDSTKQQWIVYGDRREILWPKHGLLYPSSPTRS